MSAKEKKRLLDDLLLRGENCAHFCDTIATQHPLKDDMRKAALEWGKARTAWHQAQTRKL